MVNQMTEGIFKGTGEDLLVEGDGDELTLTVVIGFVTTQRSSLWVKASVYFMEDSLA